MAFFEERFPDSIAQGAVGGPRFKTTAVEVASGARVANRDWSAPLHHFNVAQAIKTLKQFHTVRAFFWVVYGAYDGFRFKDYSDYVAPDNRGVMTLVSGNDYQLGLTYAYGSRSVIRKILKPVAGTVTVLRTRAAVVSNITLASTIDTTTGVVTVSGHLAGDTYTWSGEFDVPVYFADDNLDAAQIGADGSLLMSWNSIALVECREL